MESPGNYQVLLDLGDVLRLQNKPKEAIRFYEEALEKLPENASQQWVLYYALGVSYESNKQWDKAEENLVKALDISQNNYLILNYLGYSWLKQGKNVESAFGMVVDAYNQLPTDGHITDSLGWAFYQLGMYDRSIEYLEKAAELEPANALINEHLGDAYWLGGRKTKPVSNGIMPSLSPMTAAKSFGKKSKRKFPAASEDITRWLLIKKKSKKK